jgi:DNA ligase-4
MSFPNNESTNNVKIKTESNKKKNNNNTNVDFLPFPSPVKSFDRLADDNATSSNNIASNQHQQEAQQQQQQQQQVNIKISESCDEGNSESEDDDEEHHYTPPDPDYTQANKLPFRSLCQIFESVWSLRRTQNNTNSSIMMSRNKRGATKYEKLAILLPKKLDTMLKGGSLFPVLRLMVPDLDTHRPHMGMKEASIGKIWAEAIGLGQSSPAYKKLIKFTDPVLAGPTACGDISMAVYEVILKRFPEFVVDYNKNNNTEKETRKKQKKTKGITIGKMNQLLDELANIKHSGNQLQAQQSLTSLSSKGSGSNFTKQRRKIKWVENLFNLKLTPLEHKWIVRIILSHLNLGVGSDSIINYYHPWADNLYAANKNIKTLCATLCDDEYIRRRAEAEKKDLKMLGNHNRYVFYFVLRLSPRFTLIFAFVICSMNVLDLHIYQKQANPQHSIILFHQCFQKELASSHSFTIYKKDT